MYELINDKTLAEYEAFLQQHPKGHFAQSSLWAKQKPMWAWNAVAVRGEDGKIKGSLARRPSPNSRRPTSSRLTPTSPPPTRRSRK